MHLHRRHAYLAATIIGFLLLAPVVYRTARGDRFDWRSRRFVTTGVLVVETEPRGVTVTLGGRALKAQTPTNISSLLPGRYHLLLTKTGYAPWEKDITITGGQSTILEGIVLPLAPLDETTLSVGEFAAAAVSPDGSTLATVTLEPRGTLIDRVNVNGERHRSTTLPAATDVWQFRFSPSGRKLLVASDTGTWILPADLDRDATAVPALSPPATGFWWANDNENVLLAQTAADLRDVDTFSGATAVAFPQPVQDVLIGKSRVFFVSEGGSDTTLYARAGQGTPVALAELLGAGWRFLPDPAGTLRLRASDGSITSFTEDGRSFDDPAFRGKTVPLTITWSPSGDRYVAVDGGEVWVGERNRETKVLIGRFSEPLVGARFTPNEENVIIALDERLIMSEVDDRQGRRSITLGAGDASLEVLGAVDHNHALLVWERGGDEASIKRLQIVP